MADSPRFKAWKERERKLEQETGLPWYKRPRGGEEQEKETLPPREEKPVVDPRSEAGSMARIKKAAAERKFDAASESMRKTAGIKPSRAGLEACSDSSSEDLSQEESRPQRFLKKLMSKKLGPNDNIEAVEQEFKREEDLLDSLRAAGVPEDQLGNHLEA